MNTSWLGDDASGSTGTAAGCAAEYAVWSDEKGRHWRHLTKADGDCGGGGAELRQCALSLC